MPNVNGIYNLTELTDRVYRLLKQIQQVINTTTGVESTITYSSQAFSTADVAQQLNAALVKAYNEVVVIALAYMRQYFEQTALPVYITIPTELVNGTDYVAELTIPAITNVTFSAPVTFARVLQNVAIYEAAVTLAATRHMEVPEQVEKNRGEWHGLLVDTATSAFKSAVYKTTGILIDANGRYNLAGLEDRVLRLLKQLQERPTIAQKGDTSQTFPTQSFATTDIDDALNSALIKCYGEIVVISTGYMRQYFEQTTAPVALAIPGGLVNSTDYISEFTFPTIPNVVFPTTTSFARFVQEVCIYDSVFVLASARGIQTTEQFDKERERKHTTLVEVVNSTFTNFVYKPATAAPDAFGRYQLSEMEDRVLHLIKQVMDTQSPSSGNETSKTFPSQSFSTVDIDRQINGSLTRFYNEIVVIFTEKIKSFIEEAPEHFVQDFFVSLKANLEGPYGFPPNMIFLRSMDWKDPGLSLATARPEDWMPMYKLEDQTSRGMSQSFHAPSWYYTNTGQAFILNERPATDNSSGVRIRAATLPQIVVPNELVNATDVIQELVLPPLPGVLWPSIKTFARMMQQAAIYDAAGVLISSRNLNTTDNFEKERERWHSALVGVITNAFSNVVTVPVSVPTISSRLVRQTFSGRSRMVRRGWWGSGVGD